MVKRIGMAFVFTAFWGMACNMIIEIVVRIVSGIDYSPLTPEFIAMFPSVTIAYGVDMLLYGVIGLAFSSMLFIYEIDRIGFVLQNAIYYLVTGIVWIPIVAFLWQLWRYPQALVCTIVGFVMTDVIMTVIGYRTTKRNIRELNAALGNE
ncbi:MAG: DUF3021 family protein [Lachnospiraceae bacterium]